MPALAMCVVVAVNISSNRAVFESRCRARSGQRLHTGLRAWPLHCRALNRGAGSDQADVFQVVRYCAVPAGAGQRVVAVRLWALCRPPTRAGQSCAACNGGDDADRQGGSAIATSAYRSDRHGDSVRQRRCVRSARAHRACGRAQPGPAVLHLACRLHRQPAARGIAACGRSRCARASAAGRHEYPRQRLGAGGIGQPPADRDPPV